MRWTFAKGHNADAVRAGARVLVPNNVFWPRRGSGEGSQQFAYYEFSYKRNKEEVFMQKRVSPTSGCTLAPYEKPV